jgi:hypothetical protein
MHVWYHPVVTLLKKSIAGAKYPNFGNPLHVLSSVGQGIVVNKSFPQHINRPTSRLFSVLSVVIAHA